jgi:hypothetical protein
MDKRITQNALNFLLSKRMTFSGEDFLPLAEVVRELQGALNNGHAPNPEDGNTEAPPGGPESPEGA